jgi:hypothetical protein
LYSSPNIITVIESKRMRWAAPLAGMAAKKMHIEFSSENLKGRDHLGDLGEDPRIIFKKY